MHISGWKASLWVALAELRGSFRDRQTLLYAVVLPVCMYPVLFWVIAQGALVVQGRRERVEVHVGLASAQPFALPPDLVEALEVRPGADPDAEAAPVEPVVVHPARGLLTAEAARTWFLEAREELPLDLVLWVPDRAAVADDVEPARLYFDSADRRSKLARERVESRLGPYRTHLRGEAAAAAGHTPEDLVPFDVQRKNVAPQRDMLAYVLSFLLPMLLVVMCVMGAFFPAVDALAGEKERSTIETTLILPTSRAVVHQGKILAVCVAAVLASSLNLAALGLSAGHLLSMITSEFGSDLNVIPVLALLGILPLALLFAFFVSAILVGIASMASTFREGQALLGPVQVVFLMPAMAGVMPGLELNMGTAFLPVVNVVLAFRSMLQGLTLPVEYCMTGLSLLLYALIAIRLSLRILSNEEVLLARDTIPLSRLWSVLRSPGHAR